MVQLKAKIFGGIVLSLCCLHQIHMCSFYQWGWVGCLFGSN